MKTNESLQHVKHMRAKLRQLQTAPTFEVARDFCASVRESFYALYAESQLGDEPIPCETKDIAHRTMAAGEKSLYALKLVSSAESKLIGMYAESVSFRREMLEVLFQPDGSGVEAVCRNHVREIRLHSSVPYRAEEKSDNPPVMRLLSDIAVEMYKDHGPLPHAVGTFNRLLTRFLVKDVPRLNWATASEREQVKTAIRAIQSRMKSVAPADHGQSRNVLESMADEICGLVVKLQKSPGIHPAIIEARAAILRNLDDPTFHESNGGKTVAFFGSTILGIGATIDEAYTQAMDSAKASGLSLSDDQLLLFPVPASVPGRSIFAN